MKGTKEKLKKALDELSYNIPITTSCSFTWGEVEVPECLRKELEDKQKNE